MGRDSGATHHPVSFQPPLFCAMLNWMNVQAPIDEKEHRSLGLLLSDKGRAFAGIPKMWSLAGQAHKMRAPIIYRTAHPSI